jgi:hypothetical protein
LNWWNQIFFRSQLTSYACQNGRQGRPPTALGDLDDLDGDLGFFVFLPKLVSPKRYPEWQNGAGRT